DDGQSEQVAVLHLGLTLAQQVEAALDVGRGVEVVLRLSGSGYGRIARQLEQSQLAVAFGRFALLVPGIGIGRQESGEVVPRLALRRQSRNVRSEEHTS